MISTNITGIDFEEKRKKKSNKLARIKRQQQSNISSQPLNQSELLKHKNIKNFETINELLSKKKHGHSLPSIVTIYKYIP